MTLDLEFCSWKLRHLPVNLVQGRGSGCTVQSCSKNQIRIDWGLTGSDGAGWCSCYGNKGLSFDVPWLRNEGFLVELQVKISIYAMEFQYHCETQGFF
jgi:hypothetical protein